MRMMVLAGAVLLGGCGGNNDAEAPTATATTTGVAAQQPTGGTMAANAGTYEITTSDGRVHTQRLSSDGTFTLTSAGSQAQTGTWRTAGNQLCFTAQGVSESCYTGSQPGADGTFTMNGPGMLNGATVRKTAAS